MNEKSKTKKKKPKKTEKKKQTKNIKWITTCLFTMRQEDPSFNKALL